MTIRKETGTLSKRRGFVKSSNHNEVSNLSICEINLVPDILQRKSVLE